VAIRIQLLGRPLVEVDGERRQLAGRKPWALLAFLLLESTGPSRRELADRAWPEADDPLAAVRWALLQVRRAIAAALVEEVDGRFAIADRATFEVDIDALVAGRADPENVNVLVAGELLEGFAFDDAPDLDRWLTLQRSRLRSASAETLLWAATVLAPTDPGRAGVLAERAAALDPFDDAVHELIVDCHVRQGDRPGARSYVERVRRLYRAELGEDAPATISRPLERASGPRGGAGSERPSSPTLPGAVEARVLLDLARVRLEAGDYDSAVGLGRRAAIDATGSGDGSLEARATVDLATTLAHTIRGRDREAETLLRTALQLARALDDRQLESEVEREIGYLHFLGADYGAAEAALGRAILLGIQVGDRLAVGRARTILGACQSDRADFAVAEATLRSAIEELAAAGDERWYAYAMSFLARLQIRTGRSTLGLASATSSIAKARNSGWFALLPWPIAMLGESQLATGEIRAASETFGEAYALAREIDDPCWLAISLRGMALVAQREGDTTKAIGLLQDGLRCARIQPGSYAWAEAAILTDLVGLESGEDGQHLDDATRIVTRGPMPDLAARLAFATSPQTPGQTQRP
jgi:DNA-binding SARP family transcriptional activator